MARKITHQVTIDGRTYRRVSESHKYTHAVCCGFDLNALIAQVHGMDAIESRRREYHWLAWMAAQNPGVAAYYTDTTGRRSYIALAFDLGRIADAAARIAGVADAQGYADARAAAIVAEIQARHARGEYAPKPQTWASSHALAMKAARRYMKAHWTMPVIVGVDTAGTTPVVA